MKYCRILIFLLFTFSAGAVSGAELILGDTAWNIRETGSPSGPGPNIFSPLAVRQLEKDKKTELRIFRSGGEWCSAEIFTQKYYRFGTFRLSLRLPEGPLDSGAVFGFFLYNDRKPPYYNEVDFEMARWGFPDSPEGHFSVQPYQEEGNSESFAIQGNTTGMEIIIEWTRDFIKFLITSETGQPLQTWIYKGENIPVSKSRIHINLWLFQGNNPYGDGALSVEILDFRYTGR